MKYPSKDETPQENVDSTEPEESDSVDILMEKDAQPDGVGFI